MKRLLLLLAMTSFAHADEQRVPDDDTGMQLMGVMMRCPAISADGKHVAIYASDPGKEKGAMTSLVVFSPKGKVEQQISVVPPATDAVKAKAAAAKITKLLDDGKYQRMSRVARVSDTTDKTKFTMQLKSEDVVIDLALADKKLTISGTRDGKKLKAVVKLKLGKDGPCPSVDGYSLANTTAGYDKATQLFAFSINAEHDSAVCFAHDYVVGLK